MTFKLPERTVADLMVAYAQIPGDGELWVSYPRHATYYPHVRGRFSYSSTNHTDMLPSGVWNGPGGPASGNFDGGRFAPVSGVIAGEMITYGLAA